MRSLCNSPALFGKASAVETDVTVTERLSALITDITYDLRPPLQSLSACVQLLQSQQLGELTDDQREILAIATRASTTVQAYLEELLLYKRAIDGSLDLPFTAVDLAIPVQAAVAHVVQREADLPITTTLAPDLPPIWGDEGSIQRVVTIVLEYHLLASDRERVVLHSERRQQHVETAITNTVRPHRLVGPITEHSVLFWPRLALAAGLVQLHGGQMWQEEDGIHFTLPTAPVEITP